MDTTAAHTPWAKLHAAAKKDPKKAGVLFVLVAVMGGLWAKALFHGDPATAGAAAIIPPGAATALAPVSGSDKPRHLSGMRPGWAAVKLAPASRNLFLIDYDRFQSSGKSTAQGAPVQESGGTSNDPAKSGPSLADLKKERQILADNLQAQASQLKLQTTVMGPSPKALVNGTLVGEGDSVASFRVLRITARGMVIEREGIKLEVQMK